HRDAIRRGIQEVEYGRDECLEVRPRAGERRGPRDPIELRVEAAIVERKTKRALHAPIESHLCPRDRRRKEVQAEDPVPDEVVLLAPRAGEVEREAEVVAILRVLRPPIGELLGEPAILPRGGGIATHLAQSRE